MFFNLFFCLLIYPLFFGFFSLRPNEIVILEAFGKPIKVYETPGLKWYWPCCVVRKKFTRSLETINIHGSSVPDKNGSPLNISVVITYTISDPLALTYNIEKEKEFLRSQALEVIRRVTCHFKYRSNNPDEPTLLSDTITIGSYMRKMVNVKLKLAGIYVTRMELMEISYHPEIAQGMLQIQQAQAKIEARAEIVRGGIEIVKDTLNQLKTNEIKLDKETKDNLTKDLMVVVCSDFGRPQNMVRIR